MITYYLYIHTRLDTGEVFYVGIGRTYDSTKFYRSFTKAKRSPEWKEVYKQCGENIKVDIVNTFQDKRMCIDTEINTIKKYGRKDLGKGSLVNKTNGGSGWKDVKLIYQYSLEGDYIDEFSCAKEAAYVLNLCYTPIYRSPIFFGRAGSFQFRYFKTDKIEPFVEHKKQSKKIYQFNEIGEFIKEFPSICAASREVGCERKHFSKVTKGVSCLRKGYHWSLNRCSCIVKRLIYQYKDGILINTFTSLPKAAKFLGVNSHNSIDGAIKGKVQKQAYGYTWESKENVVINNCNEEKTENM